uniref:Vacuolar sorting protein 39/Transforming growth factor beta receptor-associated domain-containing protein n=1 Tax=Oryzias latipes TaxID=8090 RepID=A0A3P9J496_ORYLA
SIFIGVLKKSFCLFEKFHTHLAVLYLERVLSLLSDSSADAEPLTRERLQVFLREPNLYRVQFLLGETDCEQLLLERATVHGKLEEHDKALQILVHKLTNFPSAEAFCVWVSSGRDPGYRQQLFHLLLEEFLGGEPGAEAGGGELEMAAVDVLHRHSEVFDTVRVLRLLQPFLNRAIRASMHPATPLKSLWKLFKPTQYVVCLPGGVPDSPTKRDLTNSSNHT